MLNTVVSGLLASGTSTSVLGLLGGLLGDGLVAAALPVVTKLVAAGNLGQVTDLLGGLLGQGKATEVVGVLTGLIGSGQAATATNLLNGLVGDLLSARQLSPTRPRCSRACWPAASSTSPCPWRSR